MGIVEALERGLEYRATKTTGLSLKMPGGKVLRLFGAEETDAGVRVDEQEALSWTALGAAVQIVAETIATLPIKVYERQGPQERDEVRDHPTATALRERPNPEQSPVEFFESYVANVMLWGNGYAEKVRRGGRVVEVWPLNPDRVRPKRLPSGSRVYEVTLPRGERKRRGTTRRTVTLTDDEVWHTRGFASRGLVGSSLAERYKNAIGLGLATEKYVARFFRNSAMPGSAIEVDEELSPGAHQRMKDDWRQIHQGLDNAHRIAILEEGAKWRQITTDPEKAQALGLRSFQVSEASRITRVQPHLLGDLERATFSNIEQQSLEFVIHTIRPWLRRLEARILLDLFTNTDRERGLFAEWSVEGLLRGDSEARASFYQVMVNNGLMSPNEVRAKENLGPYDGGDQRFMQVSMMPVSQLAQLSTEERMRLVGSGEEAATRPEPEPRQLPEPEDEGRAVQERLRLRSSFRPVYLNAFERVVRGEVRNVRAGLDVLDGDDIAGFRTFLRDYYFGNDEALTGEADVGNGHPEFARGHLAPAVRSHALEVAAALERELGEALSEAERERFVGDYTDELVRRYSASSRRQLQKVTDVAADDPERDPREAVDARLGEWVEGPEGARPRSERWAEREVRRLDNGLSRAGIAAAGLASVWSSVGDSCPYCRELDGRRVRGDTPFLPEGTEFSPEGADAPLRPRTTIKHPPAHDGCDCLVVPGR